MHMATFRHGAETWGSLQLLLIRMRLRKGAVLSKVWGLLHRCSRMHSRHWRRPCSAAMQMWPWKHAPASSRSWAAVMTTPGRSCSCAGTCSLRPPAACNTRRRHALELLEHLDSLIECARTASLRIAELEVHFINASMIGAAVYLLSSCTLFLRLG